MAADFGKSKTPGECTRLSVRGEIIGLSNAGKNVTQISKQLGCSRSTVRRWIRREQEEGDLSTHPKNGRGRKTSTEQDLSIIQRSVRNPQMAATDIARFEGMNDICVNTVRNRLREGGRHYRMLASKEALTAEHEHQRLAFCDLHANDGFEMWGNIIFLDEISFRSECSGRLHCWHAKRTRYEEENIQRTHQQGHVSMLGWMWAHGVGELTRIENRLTGAQYVEILEEVFLPSVRAMAIPAPHPIRLVQHNCPVHTSRVVDTWFQEHPEIIRLQWPARSPDFNPIEHLWDCMVNEWEHANEKTSDALERHCHEVWESLRQNQQLCEKLVRALPCHIQACREADGGYAKYSWELHGCDAST